MKNNEKIQVVVNEKKCTGCGLCKKDCVAFDIDIVDGKAVTRGNGCIKCGHCEAICPKKAISLTGFDDKIKEYKEQVRLDPKQLLDAIKTRRSIRNFTEKKIPQNVLDMIFEAGRLAPTGSNAQGTSYILLRDKKDECEKVAVSIFGGLINFGKKFIPQLKSMNIDEKFFFKGAPVAIVVLGDDEVSASLAAENMAFMAEANGLGVLFSGFFTMVYNMSRKIRNIIGTKKDPKAVTTLVIGYSAVKYQRSIHRKPLNLVEA